MWRVAISALLALSLAACGGESEKRDSASVAPVAATSTAASPPAPEGRPMVEEQLAIIDGNRMPDQYRSVLESLARKCRESPVEIADAVVTERTTLQRVRGISISVLDYLRGLDSVIPDGRTGVDCREIAAELGENIGR
jgi:hypothetical protein